MLIIEQYLNESDDHNGFSNGLEINGRMQQLA